MGKKRLPKYKRVKNPPAMRLQDRDIKVLKVVSEHRFLTSEQIKRLFFGSPSTANFRLRKLFHHGYLDRVYLPTVVGSSPAIYCLDKEGVRLLEDLEQKKICWEKRKNIVEHRFLMHNLAVADFKISLNKALEKREDEHLELWIDEQELKERYQVWSDRRHKTLTRVFSPDGFGRIRSGEKTLSFFLEIDRGSQAVSRKIRRKINMYNEFREIGRYTERFGGKHFRVLFVTEPLWSNKTLTNQRIKTIKRQAEKLEVSFVWLTTLDEIRNKDLFEADWYRAGYEGVQNFLPSLVKKEVAQASF